MRIHLGATQQIKYPKQITTSEPHRMSESQPASMNNPFKWSLTYQNRSFVRFLSKASSFWLTQRFIGKGGIKWNQEVLGNFHKKRGQVVFVVKIKPASLGHHLKSCWLPHRRVGQYSLLVSQGPFQSSCSYWADTLENYIRRPSFKSWHFLMSCGTL